MVSFDIQRAFDSASWSVIVEEMKNMSVPTYLVNIVSSYLSNRRNRLLGTDLTFEIKQGCPQGSVLGPTLWLILINPLLTSKKLKHVYTNAFADDLFMLAGLKRDELSEFKATVESTIGEIFCWGKKRRLTFNAAKTQAILITKRIKHPEIEFEIDDQTIKTGERLVYLGLLIDKNLNFLEHVKARITSGKRALSFLNRICAKTFGLSVANAKMIYKAAIVPLVLYACEIWAALPRKAEIERRLRSFQRSCAIAVTKSWRTIRTETAVMMLNELPLDYP